MRILDLDKLKEGLPGISPVYGAFLAEAAIICLVKMGHSSGVELILSGEFEDTFMVEWEGEVGQNQLDSWKDFKEATEYGATAIALLLAELFIRFDYFDRKNQSAVGDYLLKETTKSGDKKEMAVLEISGILREEKGNSLQARLSLKTQQVKKSKRKNLQGYAIVVEFGTPKVKIKRA